LVGDVWTQFNPDYLLHDLEQGGEIGEVWICLFWYDLDKSEGPEEAEGLVLICVEEREEGEMGTFERVGYYVHSWGCEKRPPGLEVMMGLGWSEKYIGVGTFDEEMRFWRVEEGMVTDWCDTLCVLEVYT
jgi:hypothetical protein